jgi:uncharacterized repeat protein (TIGR03806 family)
MVPNLRSPRLVLGLVGAIQLINGVAFTFFYHEFFRALLVPRPSLLLAFQIWGAMGIVFGMGLLALSSNPRPHRGVLLLIMACKLAAGATCLVATLSQGLHISFALSAFLLELAPAAAIGAALTQIIPFGGDHGPGRRGVAGGLLRFTAFLAPVAIIVFILLGIASPPMLELGRTRGFIAPLAVMEVSRDSSNTPQKDQPWARLPSNFPITPGTGLDYQLTPALGGLKFTDPVCMLELPDGTERFLVAERTGRVMLVDRGRKSIFLDLSAVVHYGPYSPEEGLLNVVLHPGYEDKSSPGYHALFVFMTQMREGRSCNCVIRYQVRESGDAVNLGSELLLFSQGYDVQVHHGGGLAFGPDGFLYVGIGDGFWGAPNLHAQKIDGGFFSGILRLDVDQRGGDVSHPIRRPPENGASGNYAIPNDNPFLAPDGANLEEFFAIGFRNPWRISFDRESGQLWVADSGFEDREEINLVAKGDNGGWAYLEGSVPTQSINPQHLSRPEKPLGREIAPLYEYPRGMSYCTVGGFVYRGRKLPDLQGKFVFGDVSGQVSALCLDSAGRLEKKIPIACAPQPLMALCSLAEDAAGELYLLTTKAISREEGVIYKIERGPVDATKQLPKRLSETGLFDDLKTLKPHAALTHYDINIPFWSDHALKTRFVGTQSGLPIRGEPGLPFKIPPGAIFVKHFDFPNDLRRPDQTKRLETRVLVFTLDQRWYGLSYRWNVEGTDAELVDEAQAETLMVTQKDGAIRNQTWTFPDRHSCLSCHNSTSEGALGFSYRQLWMKGQGGSAQEKSVNQLERLRECGVLAAETLACNVNDLRPLASTDDSSRSLEDRARSYLDANCAYCHRNGVWYSTFDVRYDTPLQQSQLFTEPLLKHFTDWTNGAPVSHANPAKAIVIGSPEDSFVHRRMNTTEVGRRMPPLGREVVDDKGAQLVREWILSMKKGFPLQGENIASPPANPSRQDPVSR